MRRGSLGGKGRNSKGEVGTAGASSPQAVSAAGRWAPGMCTASLPPEARGTLLQGSEVSLWVMVQDGTSGGWYPNLLALNLMSVKTALLTGKPSSCCGHGLNVQHGAARLPFCSTVGWKHHRHPPNFPSLLNDPLCVSICRQNKSEQNKHDAIPQLIG